MTDNSMKIEVVVDTTDLRTKLAVATANFKDFASSVKDSEKVTLGFTREMNALKDAGITTGTVFEEITTNIQASALTTAQLAIQADAAKKAQNELAASLAKVTGAARGMHGSVSTATREFRALFDEITSGRVRNTPGTLAIIANSVLGIQGAVLGAGVGVAAFAAGLGYLAYEAFEANKSLNELTAAATLSGRGNELSRNFIEAESDSLRSMSGVSKDAAKDILSLEVAHAGLSATIVNQINQIIPAFVAAYGAKAPDAIKKLIEGLNDLDENGLKRLDKDLLGLTPRQYEVTENFLKIGDRASATTEILRVLGERGSIGIKSIDDQITALKAQLADQQSIMSLGVAFSESGEDAVIAANQIGALTTAIKGLEQAKAAQSSAQGDRDYKSDLQTAIEENKRLDERGNLLSNIARLQKDISEAGVRGDKGGSKTFSTALAGEQKKLADYDKRGNGAESGIQAFREALDQKLLAQQLFGERAKAFELQYWQGIVSETKKGSSERAEIERTIYDLESGLNTERTADARRTAEEQKRSFDEQRSKVTQWWADYSTGIKEQIDQARGNYDEQTRLAQIWADAGKAIYGADVSHYREASQEIIKTAQQKADDLAKVNKLINEGEIDVSKILAKGSAPAKSVSSKNLMADLFGMEDPEGALQTELEQLKATYQQQRSSLFDELGGAKNDDESQQIINKMNAGWAEYTVSAQKATDAATENYKKAWEDALQPVTRAISTSITGIIQGTQTATQGIKKLGESIILSGIDKGIQGGVNWGAGKLAGLFGGSPGGLLGGIMGGGSGAAGSAAQTTALTANTTALTTLAAALGTNTAGQGTLIAAHGTTAASLFGNTAATAVDSATTGVNAAATGTNAAVTAANTSTQAAGLGTWIANTASTIANTIATDAAAVGKFLGFAAGGDPPIGVPSLVGERGPELFVPRGAGTIIPNHQLGSFSVPTANSVGRSVASGIGSSGGDASSSGDNTYHDNRTYNLGAKMSRGDVDAMLREHSSTFERHMRNWSRNRAA